MFKQVLIPAVAALAFGFAAAMPQPAAASYLSGAAAATQINAQETSNVVDVRRNRGHHHHGHHHHGHRNHWRGAYAWSPYYFAPARSCGYRWSWRQQRHVWRCW